jgi:hypothetical protein
MGEQMKILTILILLLSFNANASYCLYELNNGNLRVDSTSVETCPSGMILLSKSEYDAINIETIVAKLKELLEVAVDDFAYFNAICLIGFIAGHSLGRVTRILGKT